MGNILEGSLALHEQIKLRLIRDVLHPETADEAFIKSDRLCIFGEWIYGEGSETHGGLAEFHLFRDAHARFHVAAYQSFCLSKSGRCDAALRSIQNGQFELASKAMKDALIDLRRTALTCT